MLVLGRKSGEEIWVGADVRITVIKLDGQTVRLGIEAPRSMRVDRAEIARKARRSISARRDSVRPAA